MIYGFVVTVWRRGIYRTLSLVASHAPGSEVVFDVIRPFEGLAPDEERISTAARASAVDRGEPWISYLAPEQLEPRLLSAGFSRVLRLTPEVAARYYEGQPADVTPLRAWELIAATV